MQSLAKGRLDVLLAMKWRCQLRRDEQVISLERSIWSAELFGKCISYLFLVEIHGRTIYQAIPRGDRIPDGTTRGDLRGSYTEGAEPKLREQHDLFVGTADLV